MNKKDRNMTGFLKDRDDFSFKFKKNDLYFMVQNAKYAISEIEKMIRIINQTLEENQKWRDSLEQK